MDLHTLHVASALTNLTCGLVLAVAWLMRVGTAYLGWWSAAFTVFAAGLLLQIAGETHPLFGALTYAFLVAGTLLMLAGYRSFDGRPAFSGLMLACLPVPPAVHLLLSAAFPGTEMAELATFLLSCAISGLVPAYVLGRNADRLAFRWIAGATFAAQLSITVTVIVWGSAIVTPANVALATSLTDQVCSTIVIACLLGMIIERDNRRLDRLAHRDALTGCLNRGGLLAYKERASGPHGVLVADLDHFKRLNDRHGHAAGDEALRAFVRRAGSCLPDSAILARTGGEEFVALLPGASEAQAEAVALAIKEAASAQPLDHEGAAIRFTVSIGVSDASDGSIRNAIRRADAALYAAKRAGRDRVAVYAEARGEENAAIVAA